MALRSSALLVGLVAFIGLATFSPADASGIVETVLSKSDVGTDQPASISITNLMDGGLAVSAHCQSSQQDEPTTLIDPLAIYAIIFQEDLPANIPWICEFSVVGGTETQSFPVWTHDGTPYLSECDECSWEVKNDGFYILSELQNVYINVHPWNNI